MTVKERICAIQLADKISKNEKYAKSIGIEISFKKRAMLSKQERKGE